MFKLSNVYEIANVYLELAESAKSFFVSNILLYREQDISCVLKCYKRGVAVEIRIREA